MAALYIHIPFCIKACHYCSFYFTLSPAKKTSFVEALCLEIEGRKEELKGQTVSSIYFGGGTPSLLTYQEIRNIIDTIHKNYDVKSDFEFSIETNPENLSDAYLMELKQLGINRLSVGIQSFSSEDLGIMNRNHNAEQAIQALKRARKFFNNLSIDLIFGLPYSGVEVWQNNLEKAIELEVDHISTYNLTVEEKTALARKVIRKELPIEPDDTLNEMYLYTLDYLSSKNFIQYEISNFGKKNHWSQHNISYWTQQTYLGFGPSAHSYNGEERKWNVSNLKKYIEAIRNNSNYWEKEVLSKENKYNEYVLTRLRTIFGVNIEEIKTIFGENFETHLLRQLEKIDHRNWIIQENKTIKLTNSGKVLADYIASELMR